MTDDDADYDSKNSNFWRVWGAKPPRFFFCGFRGVFEDFFIKIVIQEMFDFLDCMMTNDDGRLGGVRSQNFCMT